MRRVQTFAVAAVAVGALAVGAWAQPPGEPTREKKAGGEKKAQPPGTPGFQPGVPGAPSPGFFGQQPGGPGPGGFPGAPGGGFSGGPPPKADPQVEAWVKTLTDKMNDPHDAIRESARAALVAVGPPAIPALRQLAGGNDAKAYTATRLVQQIERNAGAGGVGAAPGYPGVFQPQPAFPQDGRRPDPGAPDNAPRPGIGAPDAPQRPGGGREPGPGEGRGPGAAGEQLLGRLLAELKLTDQQREKAEKVVEGYARKVRETLDDARSGKLDRTSLRDTFTKMAEEATADLKRALTPEQLRLFEQIAPQGRPLFPTPFGAPGDVAPARRPAAETPERPRPDDER